MLLKTLWIVLMMPAWLVVQAGAAELVGDNTVDVPVWEHGNAMRFDLSDLTNKFAAVESITLQQAWLPELEPGFAPTEVKVVWEPDGLYVFAQFEDGDIGSRSTGYNQRLWELGDVFELFFLFSGAEAYYEFHVSPNNHVMQLCFDLDLTPEQRRNQLPELFMPKQVVESNVWVEVNKGLWYALLKIPAATLKPTDLFDAGDTLRFSFCRYDFSAANEEPLLSSSSNHQELNFHLREDWGVLRLTTNR